MSLKFKKIEVSGFKSFADKLEIKFGEGITGIVGPNGCGKSNVADSIRWVLGEQSAKLLRGQSMQDVIFKGTESRKSLSLCEVSLYFDNTEKWFSDLTYDEVVITRKLYRSGESEYYINKQPCRLRTITEYLRDAGMGREGYSIIGQGRVESLLSAKPEDRRAIFEEAAGVSKFKAKKSESERRLLRMRENLSRVNDILAEKQRILEPLTKQAEVARKFLDLQEELRKDEINLYIHRYETTEASKTAIQNRLDALKEKLAQAEEEYTNAKNAYEEALQNQSSVNDNIAALRDEELSLSVGIEKMSGEINVLIERLNYLNNQNNVLFASSEKHTTELNEATEQIAIGKAELDKKEFELSSLRAKKEKLNGGYVQIVRESTAYEDELGAARSEYIKSLNRLTEIKTNMSSLVAEKNALSGMLGSLTDRKRLLESNLNVLLATIEAGKKDRSELIEKKNALQDELSKLQSINSELLEKAGKLADEIEKANASYYTARSRYNLMKQMKESYDQYNGSVKNLLQEGMKDKEVAARILGVVAQLLKVEQKFETAIEMSLGNAMQNIVVRTEDDAKYLIAYLKRMRFGRVTFLPISSVKPRSVDAQYKRFLGDSGIFGVASELVSCDKEYVKVVESLLGGTVIVDNMDTAVRLARQTGFSFRIVTLEGDIINPTGAITGGSKKADVANLFGNQRQLEESRVQFEKCETELKSMNSERDSVVADQQEVSGKLKSGRETLHGYEIELASKTEGLNKTISDEDGINEQLSIVNAEIEQHVNRIAAIENDINSVGDLEKTVEEKRKTIADSSQEGQKRFDELKEKREKIAEELSACSVSVVTAENLVSTIKTELSRLESNVTVLTNELAREEEQRAANTVLIEQLNKQLDDLRGMLKPENSSRVSFLRSRITNLDAFRAELQEKLTKVDALRTQKHEDRTQIQNAIRDEELKLVMVDTDMEQMQQHIFEEYNLDYEQCLEYKIADFNAEKGQTEANRLKRQIKALGYVNVAAIEQSKTEYEEYHKLDIQRNDIEKAAADLVKIIKDVSDEMLERFTSQFVQIRENFIKIFRELFDGGTADLVLLESEDPLEAGIDIIAQPPEKKLQSISLLSGGERALTAIAILFAILRLKPMPFCVLDEIEAALDDANAGRFARYLRRFSEGTQFIVITHRKPTMELADNLYGVTMEEKGVSKIVSVKLSEAVAAAESI